MYEPVPVPLPHLLLLGPRAPRSGNADHDGGACRARALRAGPDSHRRDWRLARRDHRRAAPGDARRRCPLGGRPFSSRPAGIQPAEADRGSRSAPRPKRCGALDPDLGAGRRPRRRARTAGARGADLHRRRSQLRRPGRRLARVEAARCAGRCRLPARQPSTAARDISTAGSVRATNGSCSRIPASS